MLARLAEFLALEPPLVVIPGTDPTEPAELSDVRRVATGLDNDLRWLANHYEQAQWPALERVGVELLTLFSRQRQGSALAALEQPLHGTPFGRAFINNGQHPGVQIHVTDVPQARAALEGLGMTVTSVVDTDSWRIVGGFLPVELTVAAAEVPGVQAIVASPWPVRNAEGAAANPWESASSADQLKRLFDVDGAGIDVGIISDTADRVDGGLADSIGTGDLPPANRLTVLDDGFSFNPATDEGRGMAELMYDVGPGFDFWFHSGQVLPTDFAGAYDEFRQAGVDLIVDDISVLGEPVFQDGPIAQAIDDVYLNHGVIVFGSAGNRHRESYRGEWSDGDNDGLHNFAGSDESLQFTLGGGATATFALHWSQPWGLGVQTDLDLEIWNASLQTKLADSNGLNLGLASVDTFSFTNPNAGDTTYNLVFRETLLTQADGLTLQLIAYSQGAFSITDDYVDEEPGITGNHAARYTFAIAASRYDLETIEDFSSRGPVTLFFNANGTPKSTPEIRQKPNFVAADGGDTSFFGGGDWDNTGFPNFFGTSAAAPNAAAVAGLLLAQAGGPDSLSYGELTELFQTTATGIGTGGWDPAYGRGRINAIGAALLQNGPGEQPSYLELNPFGDAKDIVMVHDGIYTSPPPIAPRIVYSNRAGAMQFEARTAMFSADADGFSDGTILDTQFYGLTLSDPDLFSGDGHVYARDYADASTGGQVFGHSAGTIIQGATHNLRFEFTTPVSDVSLDFIGTATASVGGLAWYDEDNFQIGFDNTGPLAAGQAEAITVSRPQSDIKYIKAYDASTGIPAVVVDHLRYGRGNGVDPLLFLWDVPTGDYLAHNYDAFAGTEDARLARSLSANHPYQVDVFSESVTTPHAFVELSVNGPNQETTTLSLNAVGEATFNGNLSSHDADYFAVVAPATAPPTATFRLQGMTTLNGVLTLYDAQGQEIERRNNGWDGVTETVTYSNVQPGQTYFLRVGSHFSATTGAYQLMVDFDVALPPNASIRGTSFNDSNGNGFQDSGEAGFAGRVVFSDANGNGLRDPAEPWTTTDANGNYILAQLPAGTYTIVEELPGNQERTLSANAGFETGGFVGWERWGATSIQTAAFGRAPSEGNYQALLTTGVDSYSKANLESFGVLHPGWLDGLGNGTVIEGSLLRRQIHANSGTSLSFDWNFLTNEPTPSASTNDFAFVSMVPVNSLGLPTELVDTTTTFVVSPTAYAEETGWRTFTAPLGGPSSWWITIGLVDVGNSSGESALLIDNLRLSPPAPVGQNFVTVANNQVALDGDFGSRAIQPGQITGFVTNDADASGSFGGIDTRPAGAVVFLDLDQNARFTSGQIGEPDAYAAGQIIKDFGPGVIPSAIGSLITDNRVNANANALASTGSLVLGNFGTAIWTDSTRRLRVDFETPQAFAAIDFISDDSLDIGKLEAFDAQGVLLDVDLTANLSSGQSERLTIVRPQAEIAYVIAGAHAGQTGLLDNFASGADAWTLTDSDGVYRFTGLLPGNYAVGEVLPDDWRLSTPAAFGLQITEVNRGTPDGVELENLSGRALSTAGWFVAASDSYSNINAVNATTWALPSTVEAGALLYRQDMTGLSNYWGSNLLFDTGQPGWVMLVDNFGRIVDWVGWGWNTTQLASFQVNVGGHAINGLGDAWTGTSIATGGGASLLRQGTRDNNTATDFLASATSSSQAHNLGLAHPIVPLVVGNGQSVLQSFWNVPWLAEARGTVFADLDGNGQRDAGEAPLVGRTVFADFNQDGQHQADGGIEPDDYAGGTSLATVNPDVTLSIHGGALGVVIAAASGLASTGVRVIGATSGTSWNATDRRLRIDFDSPARGIALDFIGDSAADTGEIQLFSSTGQNLGGTLTTTLSSGQVQRVTFTRPLADISYVIAGSFLTGALLIDNLTFEIEPSATSASDGAFVLADLPLGMVSIRQAPVPNEWQTTPVGSYLASLTGGTVDTGAEFGNQPNVAPVAHIGGPYPPLAVGASWTPSAAASTDANLPFGDALSYAWDLDADGQFDDASGVAPTLLWSQLAAWFDYPADPITSLPKNTVRVRVTDSFGLSSTVGTAVSVFLNEPHASFTAPASPVDAYQTVTFDGSGSSHGFPGRSIVAYEWDFDYDGSTFDVEATGAVVQRSFDTAGARTVALRVRDDNTPAVVDIATQTLQVVDSFAPRIMEVVLGSNSGAHADYSVPGGSGEQWRTVPVGGADEVALRFSEGVVIASGGMRLFDSAGVQLNSIGFQYDPATFTARWRFPTLTADRWQIVTAATTADLSGNQVDGEWDNPTSLTDPKSSAFPSGNGVAGGAFIFSFTILPGDANRDNQVTGADYTLWADQFGATDAAFTDGDSSGDGQVTGADYTLWADHYGLDQAAPPVEWGGHRSRGAAMHAYSSPVSAPTRAIPPLDRPLMTASIPTRSASRGAQLRALDALIGTECWLRDPLDDMVTRCLHARPD